MKKIKLINKIIPLFILSMLLFSCGSDDSDNNPSSCEDAIQISTSAALELISATNDTYTELCNVYKESLEDQIDSCGDDNGSIQTIIDGLGDCDNFPVGNSCEDLSVNVFGSGFTCNNDLYGGLQINNVYIEEEYPTDENNDGVNDHFFTRLYITDGTATLDANNMFVSFSDDRTYVFEIALKSLGTSGLTAGEYIPFANVNVETSSYFSLAVSEFSINNCDPQFYLCEDRYTPLGAVAIISGTPGNFSLCFSAVIDFDDNCFNGTFDEGFIIMNTL